MHTLQYFYTLIAICIWVSTNLNAQAPTYNITVLPTDSLPNVTSVKPIALNNLGEVVGTWTNNHDQSFPFFYSSGVVLNLGSPLGGTNFEGTGAAHSINDNSQIVGGAYIPEGYLHAYRIDSTESLQAIDLGALLGVNGSSIAYAINNAGQVVGASSIGDAFGNNASVLFINQTLINLSNANATVFTGFADGINDVYGPDGVGQIIGQFYDPSNLTKGLPYVYINGEMINLYLEICPLPTTVGCLPLAINNAQQMVGYHEGSSGFLYDLSTGSRTVFDEATPRDINDQGWIILGSRLDIGGVMYQILDLLPKNSGVTSIYPSAINNQGQIIAIAYFKSNPNKPTAVLLTPLKPIGQEADPIL